jgi:diadenosine tetraphosphate (Ap4A) HIT family hydrolase
LDNFQTLCWLCNGNKGARDDTDFRAIREALVARQAGSPFCEIGSDKVVAQNSLAVAFFDAFPAPSGHALIIPKRHAENWFDLYEPERRSINLLVDEVRAVVGDGDKQITGFNIGMNRGADAGQTIFHAHVHLIPRRHGDVENPRDGVRGDIPGKQDYRNRI